MWLLALIGCAEHIFGSREIPCDDVDSLILIATHDLAIERVEPEVPGSCEVRTDATVRATSEFQEPAYDGVAWGNMLVIEGVARAELRGVPRNVHVVFDGALSIEDEADEPQIRGSVGGSGELTYAGDGPSGEDELWMRCTSCSGTLLTTLMNRSSELSGGGVEVCGDAGGNVVLADGASLTLGVGGRRRWTVAGQGEVYLDVPPEFSNFAIGGDVTLREQTERTTTCFGEDLPTVFPPDCAACELDPCLPGCDDCGETCTVTPVSAIVEVNDEGFRVDVDGPDGTYTLGVFDLDFYNGSILTEACVTGATGEDAFWAGVPSSADPGGVVTSCHEVGRGNTSFGPADTTFDNAHLGLTFVLLDGQGGCWTGGEGAYLYELAYPGCTADITVEVEPPTPRVEVASDDAYLVLTVDGLREPVLFGGILYDDESGFEAYQEEDCVGDHVCHPLPPGGGALEVLDEGTSVEVTPGLTTRLGLTGETSWLLKGEVSGRCWTWGAPAEAWDVYFPCETPEVVDAANP